ncbi:MAG: tetratricopeptide repeat protein [Phycisphaerae bacterium]
MGRIGALMTAAILVVAAGCGQLAWREDHFPFEQGYAALEAGRWHEAAEAFTTFLQAHPGSPARGEAYYYRGLARVRLGARDEALADFQHAVRAAPPPPIDAYAHVAIGNLHYEAEEDREAVLAYARALKNPPDDLPLERVLLRLAISLQRIGKWRSADTYLAYVMEHYPKTAAAAAEARRRYRAGAFSVQTGAYASSTGASHEAARLRAAGFQPRLGMTERNRKRFHTVRVGQARTYAEAVALAKRVGAAGFATWVVP